MNDTGFLTLLMRYQDGVLSPAELASLEAELRGDAAKRQLFAETQLRSMALHDRFRQEAFQRGGDFGRKPQPNRPTWINRPMAAMVAGLVIGLFSASLLWAIASPKTTTERLFNLSNGSFDHARLDRGFPRQTGLWSGDDASIRNGKLGFLAPGSDANNPSSPAIACDVFQLVDLHPLRPALSSQGDAVLELSTDFLDDRPANTQPSITFFCQIYLFQGDLKALHKVWPQSNAEALASGSAQVTTLGADPNGLHRLSAKCLVPANADFAVIQIAARPNLRPAKLEGLFADDVRLTLKTQPALPVRLVQH